MVRKKEDSGLIPRLGPEHLLRLSRAGVWVEQGDSGLWERGALFKICSI